jgi:hypothetical protein
MYGWILSNWGGRIGVILGTIAGVLILIFMIVEMLRKGNITIIVPIVIFVALASIGILILGIIGAAIGSIVKK